MTSGWTAQSPVIFHVPDLTFFLRRRGEGKKSKGFREFKLEWRVTRK